MPRMLSARRPVHSTGQSVYEVMLILACAAMALALCFAAFEYVSFYRGDNKPYKFDTTTTRVQDLPKPEAHVAAPKVAPQPVPKPVPAAAAPAATTAPAPAATRSK